VWAWGRSNYGQLGDNTTTNKSSPIAVAGSRSFSFLSEMPPPPPEPGSSNLVSQITSLLVTSKDLVCRLSVDYSDTSTNLVCRITNPASFPTIWGENNPTGGETNAGNWYKWSNGSGGKPDVT